jgi:undecaprenyl-diphosphatase
MMIEYFESIDRTIVQLVNSWHTPFLDQFMWVISEKATWIPLYALMLYLFIRQYGFKSGLLFLLCAIGTVAISDLTSVHLFKESFMRYRPSHNLLLTDTLHFYQFDDGEFYKGGMYGFVSSHATNFLAVCTFAYLALRRDYPKVLWLFLIAALLVLYSRIYFGVHYLSDVLFGAILGILIAYLVFRFVFIGIIGKEYNQK